jgi:hypothetical protein
MASETIQEFLASFGYKIDESSERKFTGSLEAALQRPEIKAIARVMASIDFAFGDESAAVETVSHGR